MRRSLRSLLIALNLAIAVAGAVQAAVPDYIGKLATKPQDTAAIEQVVADFQTAIKTHNPKLLSTLVLNSNILFASPAGPALISAIRGKQDTVFDGLPGGGYARFASFIGQSKDAIEEKFYNLKITQDANVAWVMFDYEFVENGKTTNYGVETWQMMLDAEGKWKIVSVVWSTKLPPA